MCESSDEVEESLRLRVIVTNQNNQKQPLFLINLAVLVNLKTMFHFACMQTVSHVTWHTDVERRMYRSGDVPPWPFLEVVGLFVLGVLPCHLNALIPLCAGTQRWARGL